MKTGQPLPDLPHLRRQTALDVADAPALAALLRGVRLAVLVGDDAAAASDLLTSGLLPLLRRRRADSAAADTVARVVIPFPDRRRAPPRTADADAAAPARDAEIVVRLDVAAAEPPLPRLKHALHNATSDATGSPLVFARDADSIEQAIARSTAFGSAPQQTGTVGESLAALVSALRRQHGARFLVVLDGFGACLRAAQAADPAARALLDDMVQALRRPLPINFLVALESADRDELDRLRARVPGLDDHALRLPGAPAPVPPILRSVAPAPAPAEPEPDWLASLTASIARVAASAAEPDRPSDAASTAPPMHAALRAARAVRAVPDEPPADGGGSSDAPTPVLPPAPPSRVVAPVHVEAPAAQPALQAPPGEGLDGNPGATTPAVANFPAGQIALADAAVGLPPWTAVSPDRPRIARLGIAAAVAVVLVGVVALLTNRGEAPTPQAAVRPTAPAPVAPAPVAAPVLPDIDSTPRLLAELSRALGPSAEPADATAWPRGFMPLPGHPGLALARYDALRAARLDSPDAPIGVVAPLYTEAVVALARADSPLAAIHDIDGARINAGPRASAGAVTAAMLHERLFGTPLPVATTRLDGGAALAALLGGRDVDVVLTGDAQPADWLTALPPRVKLLKADAADPRDRRVLQNYLPLRLADGTPSFGVMTFLVAAAGTGDQAARAARALCAGLPALRRDGHPAWRSVRPALHLDTGWPDAPGAAQALRACSATP